MQNIPVGNRDAHVLLIFLIVMGLACTLRAEPATTPVERPPVVIGVCLPLSGKDGAGQVQHQALRIAQRIRPLAGDSRVELIIKDTLASAEGTRKALQSMLAEHDVAALIGGDTPDEAAAMLDVVSRDRRLKSHPVPVVITTAGEPLNDAPHKPWRVSTPLAGKARAAAGFAVGKLKAKRVGILLDPADAGGVRLASLFSSALIAQGGVVAEIAYLGKTEWSRRAALAALTKKRVEVIFLPDARSAPQVIVYGRDQGIKTPFLLADVRREGGFVKAVGASKDVYVVMDFHPAFTLGENAKRFLEMYRREHGEPETLAALTADAYFLLCDALPHWRAGKGRYQPQALMHALKDTGYLSGKIEMSTTGMLVRNVYICEIHASRLKCLETVRP